MEQERLLQKIGSILSHLDIPYIITGGIAVAVWGRPRFTADIDIVIQLIPQKLEKLAKELLKIDKYVYVDRKMMLDALERKGEFNFIHPSSGLKVDFWILSDKHYDEIMIKRKIAKKIGKQRLFFTSPEDLILSKLLWYKETVSSRQLEDVESVIKIQKDLDWDYLEKWAQNHSTIKILKSLKNKLN